MRLVHMHLKNHPILNRVGVIELMQLMDEKKVYILTTYIVLFDFREPIFSHSGFGPSTTVINNPLSLFIELS